MYLIIFSHCSIVIRSCILLLNSLILISKERISLELDRNISLKISENCIIPDNTWNKD